jgi:hypothetical protein
MRHAAVGREPSGKELAAPAEVSDWKAVLQDASMYLDWKHTQCTGRGQLLGICWLKGQHLFRQFGGLELSTTASIADVLAGQPHAER